MKCKIVLRKNEIPVGKLKNLIEQLRGNPDPSTFRGGDLRRLSKDGYFPVFDFGRQYREEQESWDKAEKLTLQLIDLRKRLKGAEDLDTLDSMGNLVSIYQKQGRWKEAEELDRQSMQTRNRFIWIDDSC